MNVGDKSIDCRRCSGSMEPGFIVDEGYGKRVVAKWVAGEPRKSFWTGLRIGGQEQLEVATYRCRQCGYLESYA
jgi:hypothetical protein